MFIHHVRQFALRVSSQMYTRVHTPTTPVPTTNNQQPTKKHRSFILHDLLRSMITKGLDWTTRSVMRTGSMLLTRRAKLDALSSAIRWVMRQQNNQPLHVSHDSGYGHLSLMSNGDLIQLTWRLTDHQQVEPSSGIDQSCEHERNKIRVGGVSTVKD